MKLLLPALCFACLLSIGQYGVKAKPTSSKDLLFQLLALRRNLDKRVSRVLSCTTDDVLKCLEPYRDADGSVNIGNAAKCGEYQALVSCFEVLEPSCDKTSQAFIWLTSYKMGIVSLCPKQATAAAAAGKRNGDTVEKLKRLLTLLEQASSL